MKNIKTTIQTLAKCNSGSKYAASIGGGYGDGSGMKEITIYGGKVTAQGAQYGAGVGGGKNNNHPSTINIYGGTVNATGGEYGAGIGGGQNRGGWNTNTLHSSLFTSRRLVLPRRAPSRCQAHAAWHIYK